MPALEGGDEVPLLGRHVTLPVRGCKTSEVRRYLLFRDAGVICSGGPRLQRNDLLYGRLALSLELPPPPSG
jgi:hypothetical protein